MKKLQASIFSTYIYDLEGNIRGLKKCKNNSLESTEPLHSVKTGKMSQSGLSGVINKRNANHRENMLLF